LILVVIIKDIATTLDVTGILVYFCFPFIFPCYTLLKLTFLGWR